MIERAVSLYRDIKTNEQLMNSLYLIMATLALAGFGFVFWAVVTRLHDSSTVGLAATILSLSGLLSMLGLAGFDTTFVRFLPKAQRPGEYIGMGILVVAGASLVLSLGCLLLLPIAAPEMAFISSNFWYGASFVFFTVMTALNTLTNAVFLAAKRARSIFVINMAFSVVKVGLPLLLIQDNAMLIFTLAGVSQLVGLVISLGVVRRMGYKISFRIKNEILRKVKKYSFSVYISSVLNLLPPTLLPIMIVQSVSSEDAAYYYMAFTIASVLYTVAYASMQSAFAEGAHDEVAMRDHLTKAAKLVLVLLLPATILTFALSGVVLGIFGAEYAENGVRLLQLFAVAAIFVSAYSALGTVFKVTKNLRGVIVMNSAYMTVILLISWLLLPELGVQAVGWAWLAGNAAACLVGVCFLPVEQLKALKEVVYGKIASARE